MDSMVLLYMLLEVKGIAVCLITNMALIRSDVLVIIHMAFIAGNSRESFMTEIALI